MNVIIYRRILDEGAERTRQAFKDHPRFHVTILQKPERFREDYELYKPDVVLVDWGFVSDRRAALLGRLRKLDNKLFLGVSLPDFLADGVLSPLKENEAVQFVIASSAGNAELDLTFTFLEQNLALAASNRDIQGKYDAIIGEYNEYRATLAEKEATIASLQKHINEILTFDPLTQQANERHFQQQLKITLDESRRYKENVCLIYLSIDNREQIEEVYGKEGIDAVIKETAERIRRSVRNNDLTGIRDDHSLFLVCYKKIRLESVRVVASRLMKSLEEHVFLYQGRQIRITVSLGLASAITYAGNTFEFDALDLQARTAYENALKKGGNVMVAYA